MSLTYVPVVITVNEKYLPYAKVAIASMLENAKKRPVDVIIGYYDIPQSAQDAFLAGFDPTIKGGNTIRFVSLKEHIDRTSLRKAETTERFTEVVLYRLVLPDVLQSVDRFVFIDADVIVRADISELYEVDMGDNWIAAARGVGFPGWVGKDPKKVKWYHDQGVTDIKDYFNAGIMVVNAAAFRKNNLFPNLLQKTLAFSYFKDQDALNIVCRGHIHYLDLKWNAVVSYSRERSHDPDGNEFVETIADANILHFNSRDKPWNHPALFLAEEWWRHAGNDDYGSTEIKLYYYNDWPNFGDSLSQKLVAELSGATVIHAPFGDAEMLGAGSLFSTGDRFFGSEERPMEKGKPVLRVWGAGFLHPEIPEGPVFRYRDMIIHAVRGRKTLEALRRVGYVAEDETPALGDPGLLYADLFPECKTAGKKYDIALIPHRHDQVAALKLAEHLRAHGYSVVYVDVMLSEPRDIILQIAESRKVLSSSLHGIIVADSLGIPNRRLLFDAFASCPQCQHAISHFKFEDYYSAFGLEAPAYETEAHLLADPKAVVESITAADCVPKVKVESCKAALLAVFPIPENARRKTVVPVEEVPVPKTRRMKVLMVCEPDFLNPFPQHIYNEILEYDLDADCSAELFWTCDPADYDIVHVQFPEAFFKWQVDDVTPEQMKKLTDRLAAFRAAECKIVYTRHNEGVHIPRRGCIDKVYKMLDAESDGILHMGRYSIMECKGKNPNSRARHYLVPHHTYPHLLRKVDRRTCCLQLGLDPDRPVVLSFGSFRNDRERALVRNAVAECGVDGVQLLAPALSKGGFVSDRDLPLYFGAADVVFLQRVRILNSGNLSLGFYYGKVVVGPNLCDVGEWLRATGNPVFEVFRPGSEAVALAEGIALAKQGLGAKNRVFADREWSLEAVGARVVAAYADLTGRPLPDRSGTMQFKRIDIGVATEYLRARNREHRLNLDKAGEIKKLRSETSRLNAECATRKTALDEMAKRVFALNAELAKMKAIAQKNDQVVKSLSREVNGLKNSASYRFGMFVTWPLRKIYRAFNPIAK